MTEEKLPDPPYGMSSEARERWDREQKRIIKKPGGLEESVQKTNTQNLTIRIYPRLFVPATIIATIVGAGYFASCNKKTEIPKEYVSQQVLIDTRDSAYAIGFDKGSIVYRDSLQYYKGIVDSLVQRTEEDASIIKNLNESIETRRYLQSH